MASRLGSPSSRNATRSARGPGGDLRDVEHPKKQAGRWYSYHQRVSSALLKEIALAKGMGFESIIVDDGWQTLDSARGYACTGDWGPERMPDMKAFVAGSHDKGVKVLLWCAVRCRTSQYSRYCVGPAP